MSKSEIATVFATGVVSILVFVGIAYVFRNALNQTSTYAPAQQVESSKPATKTRCDLTGLMASSIIEEEAKNGYVFSGRVKTFLCGDNGMSFYLK